MSEALSSLDDDITEVMRRAKAMGHDPLATARQRYPDAHSSAFTEAQLRLYKAEKAAFEASVERAADQTIDSDCVDVTPTSQALTIPAPGCAGPKQPAAPVSASASRKPGRSENLSHFDRRVHDRSVSDLQVGPRLRSLDENVVAHLMESMRTIGLIHPIMIQGERGPDGNITGRDLVRAGLHRLEAAKRLGWSRIQCKSIDVGYDVGGELVEVTENLHRAELTAQERADHIVKWIELVQAKARFHAEEDGPVEEGAQVGHPSVAQPHDKGIAKAARELRLTRQKIQRAVKIASITPEAKAAAKAAGIDDNQSKLLKVAAAPTEKQVELIEHLTAARPDVPKDDGFDIPPLLIRDPDAKAKAVNEAIDSAVQAIGALAVAELVVVRLAPHERLSLAPPAPALQPEVEATKTVIDWVFEIKHSINRAVASSLSKRDLEVLFGHLGQHIANWERKVAERDQRML